MVAEGKSSTITNFQVSVKNPQIMEQLNICMQWLER